MAKLTKEWLQKTIAELEEERDATPGVVNEDAAKALAAMKIALASLEAEPVYQFIYNNPYEEGYTEWLDCNKDYFNGVPEDCRRILYTAPPAPVSDSLISELLAIAKKAAEEADECAHAEWNDDSMEHSAAISDWERRAAMLQGADGNSPVIPDGWKLVPIDPTKDMLRAGQSVVGFWLNTVHCYSKMLAAAPAAPKQEVTQALAKGMERYGDAMQKLADSGD
jgi:hypothetical protein